MSVVDYDEVVGRVFAALAEAKKRGEWAAKVLMSRRQHEAFKRGQYEFWGPYASEAMTLYGLPIVICPDCDLYVVCFKVVPEPEPFDGHLPTLSMEMTIGEDYR